MVEPKAIVSRDFRSMYGARFPNPTCAKSSKGNAWNFQSGVSSTVLCQPSWHRLSRSGGGKSPSLQQYSPDSSAAGNVYGRHVLLSKSGSKYELGLVHALTPQRGYMRSSSESVEIDGRGPSFGSKQR